MMKEQLEAIRKGALDSIVGTKAAAELDSLRVKYLGKKGELTAVLKQMGSLSAEERPIMGQMANEVRAAVDLFAEDLEPAHRFFDLQLSLRRDDGHARGVIPAVFQMREPVQQDGGRLFLTNESNDSAHMITFSF